MLLLLFSGQSGYIGTGTFEGPAVFAGVGSTLVFTGTGSLATAAAVLAGTGTNIIIFAGIGAVTFAPASFQGYETEPSYNLVSIIATIRRIAPIDQSIIRIAEIELDI